jgi:hypothetical protein
LLGDRLGRFSVSAVINHIGRLVFGLRQGFDSRGAFSRRLSPFRCDARSGVFETEKHQAGHDPDKNAELDRNKMCDFQIHFPKPLPGDNRDDGTKRIIPSFLRNLLRNGRCNNLKICEAPVSWCASMAPRLPYKQD